MSFSEKDRKVQSNFGRSFPKTGDAPSLAAAIAAALKAEFGSTPAALKTVALLTRSNERAVRNWFEGKNGPSGENLIILMRQSEQVLKVVLTLADRRDLAVAVGLASVRSQLMGAVAAIDALGHGNDPAPDVGPAQRTDRSPQT